MVTFYTIDQYRYSIYFDNKGEKSEALYIMAINYNSLDDYRCNIIADKIKDYKLISSLDELYTTLSGGFLKYQTDIIQLETKYNAEKDEINIKLTIKCILHQGHLNFTLERIKNLTNQDILNKMSYFNKRLINLEREIKEQKKRY